MEERGSVRSSGSAPGNTFAVEVHALVARAEYLPWLDPEEQAPIERLAGA